MQRSEAMLAARIIAAAITAGPAMFLGVAYFLIHRPDAHLGANETGSLISMVSLVPTMMAITLFPILPRLVTRQQTDPLVSYRTTLIIRLAIAEGAALLGCVGYLLEGRNTPLGAGVALAMIVFMAAQFPTESRLDSWIQTYGAGESS